MNFDFSVDSDEGAVFTPWTDGHAVGFSVTAPDLPDRYVFLNPSGGTDTGDIYDSDVFVYLEEADTEPGSMVNSVCFVNIWDRPA